MQDRQHVLSGLVVLDFTQYLAGPRPTQLMAEMGAEVIKVEMAPGGDLGRRIMYIKNGRSCYYVQQNLGKKSLCVNLRHPKGVQIVRDLLPHVDVLVENFSPGVIARLGFDYETVSKINPRIVMCSISTLGQSGPLSHKPGFDYIGQSYAGVAHMIGEANGPPANPGLGLGDVMTGVHGLSAILAALLYRERTGKGQHVEVSLLDVLLTAHEVNIQAYSASGGAIKPKRRGPYYPWVAPAGYFKGKEHYICIVCVTPENWQNLCQVMGRPGLAEDPRFDTVDKRIQNIEELAAIIEEWMASLPSDEEIVRRLDEVRVPVAPVLSIEEVLREPHIVERGAVRKIVDRVAGEFVIPGFPLHFSLFPENLPLEAPLLGEHNAEVLGKYLGYTPEQVRALEAEGVLHREET